MVRPEYLRGRLICRQSTVPDLVRPSTLRVKWGSQAEIVALSIAVGSSASTVGVDGTTTLASAPTWRASITERSGVSVPARRGDRRWGSTRGCWDEYGSLDTEHSG